MSKTKETYIHINNFLRKKTPSYNILESESGCTVERHLNILESESGCTVERHLNILESESGCTVERHLNPESR